MVLVNMDQADKLPRKEEKPSLQPTATPKDGVTGDGLTEVLKTQTEMLKVLNKVLEILTQMNKQTKAGKF